MSKKETCTAAEIKIALAKKHKNDYFLTEVKSGSAWIGTGNRILDACALRCSYTNPHITGYEVKVTRSDFKRDNKFFTYLPLVHALYVATPTGMVQREELPTEIGLIWYDSQKKGLSVKKKPPPRKIEISRDMLLYIIFSRLDRERIPFYSDKAEYWRAWLDGKIENDALAQKVRNRLASELGRLENELRAASRYGNERKEYDELRKTMVGLGMSAWEQSPAKWLTKQLTRKYPAILDDIKKRLREDINEIKKAKEAAQNGGQKT